MTTIAGKDLENPISDSQLCEQKSTDNGSNVSCQSSDDPGVIVNYKATKAPKDTLAAVYKAGEYKAGLPLSILMVQSFMAGIYIGMAGHLYLAVGGDVLGAALFPTGLIAVILTSAELFTGDALIFVASVLGRRVSVGKLVRNWTVSWIFNFIGCLFWAAILSYGSDALESKGQTDFAIHVALKKLDAKWYQIFFKAIGANFMVCLGLWQALTAEEVAGKVLGIWFPVCGFILMGFDHCIANQFLISIGMMLGGDISLFDLFIHGLLPATLGNIVGGGVLLGGVYWFVYDSMASNKQLLGGVRQTLLSQPKSSSSSLNDRKITHKSDEMNEIQQV